jgi:hypothetical protein
MEIDPQNKATMDALYDVTARTQARRATIIWNCWVDEASPMDKRGRGRYFLRV